MRRVACFVLLCWCSAADAQTINNDVFTLDRIIGSLVLPGNLTSNATNRSHGSDPDQFMSPNAGLTANGKLLWDWTYSVTALANYEAYNRLETLENSLARASAVIRRQFGDYTVSFSYGISRITISSL